MHGIQDFLQNPCPFFTALPRNAGRANLPWHEKKKVHVKKITFNQTHLFFPLFSVYFAHTTGSAQSAHEEGCFPGKHLTFLFNISSFYAFLLLFKNNSPPSHLRWARRAAAPGTPAVGKSRTVFVSAFEPRTHAVFPGAGPTPGFCFPGLGKSSGASPTHRNARKS